MSYFPVVPTLHQSGLHVRACPDQHAMTEWQELIPAMRVRADIACTAAALPLLLELPTQSSMKPRASSNSCITTGGLVYTSLCASCACRKFPLNNVPMYPLGGVLVAQFHPLYGIPVTTAGWKMLGKTPAQSTLAAATVERHLPHCWPPRWYLHHLLLASFQQIAANCGLASD